jgi:hypothetical protein
MTTVGGHSRLLCSWQRRAELATVPTVSVDVPLGFGIFRDVILSGRKAPMLIIQM